MKKIIVISALLLLAGCASVLNPYEEDFTCPFKETGKCVSMEKAYKESFQPEEKATENGEKLKQQEGTETVSAENEYLKSLYKSIQQQIEEPVKPVVIQPKVLRLLIISYPGSEDELYTSRFVYFFAGKPRWLLGPLEEDKEK